MKQHSVEVKNVSRETWEQTHELFERYPKLNKYIDLLIAANSKVNLVSRQLSREDIKEHVVHSLIPMSLGLLAGGRKFIDIGTGGGLPGVPLGLCYSDKEFILNDKSPKKQKALAQIIVGLELSLASVLTCGIADFDHYQPITMLSKHAFKLPKLLNSTKKIRWDNIIVWKGLDFQSELREINYKPLYIEAYDLSDISDFYEGKYILHISKIATEEA